MPTPRHRRRATALATAVAAGIVLTTLPAAGASGEGGLGDPYFPEDGNSGYDVSEYDVHVHYDPAHPRYLEGDTTVEAVATQDLDVLHLDLEGFTVTGVTVNGTPARTVSREGAHELVITPARPVAKNTRFSVRVRYSGEPVGKGWHTLADGGANASEEPHSATAWYPANDHPSDKATFRLTATVPTGWTVVGNGRPGATTTERDTSTFRWYEDRPMATYLSTIAIDTFTMRTSKLSDGTPVVNAYSPGSRIDPEAEAQLPEILDFLASKFGPYPFSSAGAIVISGNDDEGPLALETQSRPTYHGSLFDLSMVHENAHQWFGNSVSFTDWRDGCLAECFAQYAGQLWDEKSGADLDEGFYAAMVEESAEDPDFWTTRLYDPGQGRELDGALYSKGSMMLHALRRTVGDDAFFGTLKRWQRDHRYGNASWPQFEALAQKVSGKDLTGFFHAWAHGTTAPPKEYLFPGSLGSLDPSADPAA
ncbi:M1 family metallopeptidase [Streptomyces griseoaurantiacus]|uniref:Aminopeptidase N n=1 Tax=Streptomyces griseoaurantiacus M045 TaxID=996637 RepID=F3NEW6_9ACTN|nr:M1 family metallopeptidase [Streptomyces griseoaurantiacus]EGG48100.1 putative metallopeptidase [Streptomyces griseoaurantiacus M045]